MIFHCPISGKRNFTFQNCCFEHFGIQKFKNKNYILRDEFICFWLNSLKQNKQSLSSTNSLADQDLPIKGPTTRIHYTIIILHKQHSPRIMSRNKSGRIHYRRQYPRFENL
jgi:hypothetical protein